ncbi:MAG: 3-phosphoserine/phosphohydroxythreonine transaminase [Candidatus Kapaibacteriales bacterium]
MNRIHNFSAGPAILPIEVLDSTAQAVKEYNGLGMSLMEMSHRSKPVVEIFDEAMADCLKLMGLSSNDYDVFFLGGGASLQFLMTPWNFLSSKAAYINTGTWADKAIKEAKNIGETVVVGSSEDDNFNFIPKNCEVPAGCDYIHFTSNNTIFGTRFHEIPETNGAPLVCDMSSDIFSRQLDFSKFDMIYAGAQKNMGPAGATMIVLKKSFLESKGKDVKETMLSYKTHVSKDSMFNTPPVLPVYTLGQTFKWLLANGGVSWIEEINNRKAGKLYDAIDSSGGFYKGSVVHKEDRSIMNVTFNLASEELESKFIAEASSANLSGLKGHRSVGGVRASIYNALPEESVDALVSFMDEFKANNG